MTIDLKERNAPAGMAGEDPDTGRGAANDLAVPG